MSFDLRTCGTAISSNHMKRRQKRSDYCISRVKRARSKSIAHDERRRKEGEPVSARVQRGPYKAPSPDVHALHPSFLPNSTAIAATAVGYR